MQFTVFEIIYWDLIHIKDGKLFSILLKSEQKQQQKNKRKALR